MIGAALALILSLSIIPAQRAAEAFFTRRLEALCQGSLATWCISDPLVLNRSISAVGHRLPSSNGRSNLHRIQFLLLGISFDALRIFHRRTLDLLIPQTAIQLIIRECTKLLNRVSRLVDKLSRLQALASGGPPTDASRAIYFSASPTSGALRFWIAQLEEIAHKLIARRDTSAANEIIVAMGRIGTQYSEARRNSLILLPDFDNLFAGGASDISDVLNPIYESIRVICEDAAKAPNELIVKQGIQTLAGMTANAMTMVHSTNGWQDSAARVQRMLLAWTMLNNCGPSEHGRRGVVGGDWIQNMLLAQKSDVATTELEAQALESLLTLALASYAKPDDAVWGFPAVKAMLLSGPPRYRASRCIETFRR